MRAILAGFLLLFFAVSATAGTITSISPSVIPANSGEVFLDIYGESLGDLVIYEGPGGYFEMPSQTASKSKVTAWVPLEIVNTPGSYSVVVRGTDGDSRPARLEVKELAQPLVLLVPDPVVV